MQVTPKMIIPLIAGLIIGFMTGHLTGRGFADQKVEWIKYEALTAYKKILDATLTNNNHMIENIIKKSVGEINQ